MGATGQRQQRPSSGPTCYKAERQVSDELDAVRAARFFCAATAATAAPGRGEPFTSRSIAAPEKHLHAVWTQLALERDVPTQGLPSDTQLRTQITFSSSVRARATGTVGSPPRCSRFTCRRLRPGHQRRSGPQFAHAQKNAANPCGRRQIEEGNHATELQVQQGTTTKALQQR